MHVIYLSLKYKFLGHVPIVLGELQCHETHLEVIKHHLSWQKCIPKPFFFGSKLLYYLNYLLPVSFNAFTTTRTKNTLWVCRTKICGQVLGSQPFASALDKLV